jgi:hypothetical protein
MHDQLRALLPRLLPLALAALFSAGEPAAAADAQTAPDAPATTTETTSAASEPVGATTGGAAPDSPAPGTPAGETGATAAPPAPAEAGAAPAEKTLEGNVHASVISALNALKQAGRSATQLRHASGALYDEVSTPEVQIVDEPELIAGVVVSLPISFQTGQLLAPRKKWVDHDMEELTQVYDLIKADVSEIVIPAENKEQAQPIYNELTAIMQSIGKHIDNLKRLTDRSDNYDAATIAIESASVHKDVEQFEDLRRKLYKAIRDKD